MTSTAVLMPCDQASIGSGRVAGPYLRTSAAILPLSEKPSRLPSAPFRGRSLLSALYAADLPGPADTRRDTRLAISRNARKIMTQDRNGEPA